VPAYNSYIEKAIMEPTMNTILSIPVRMAAAGIATVSLALMLSGSANAEERRERRHDAGEPYRSPHWIYDDRYHHSHYYPAIGYSVAALPPGYITLGFRNRRFFFQGGVWFAPSAAGFAVVRPPVGVIVPMLPPAYTTVWSAGAPYYYANDIYYAAAPGGYAVIAPPAGTNYTEAPAAAQASQAPPVPPAPSLVPPAGPAAQSAGATWSYCESARAYYPYVSECKEGWRQVPANPPQPR
jgi:hypothetical protein